MINISLHEEYSYSVNNTDNMQIFPTYVSLMPCGIFIDRTIISQMRNLPIVSERDSHERLQRCRRAACQIFVCFLFINYGH